MAKLFLVTAKRFLAHLHGDSRTWPDAVLVAANSVPPTETLLDS